MSELKVEINPINQIKIRNILTRLIKEAFAFQSAITRDKRLHQTRVSSFDLLLDSCIFYDISNRLMEIQFLESFLPVFHLGP